MVLRQLPLRKIAPLANPKTNPNPTLNPNWGTIFLGETAWLSPNTKTNPNIDPNPNLNRGAILLAGWGGGGQLPGYQFKQNYSVGKNTS